MATVVKKTPPEIKPVRVVAIFNKMRHPVTGQVFHPGQAVEIINLEDPIHIFVKHQIDAGVFKIVD